MPVPMNEELSNRMRLMPDQVVRLCRIAVKEAGGNISQAAKKLGIGRRTLYRWISEHPEIREGGA